MGTEWKTSILNSDMPDEMQSNAIDIARKAVQTCDQERDIAAFVKKAFDKKYEAPWHCVVGRHFGSYVSHEKGNCVYFQVGRYAFLLFKSGQ